MSEDTEGAGTQDDGGSENQGCESDGKPHLATLRDVETVYQPAEDSHLLATTVVDTMHGDERLLDVGTGSGYIAGRIRTETGASVLGVDVNPDACKQAASHGIPVVRGDMFNPFQPASFDVVVCNPPYLPTPPDQEWDDWMEEALSGGPDGRAMVDPFIAEVGSVLKQGGRAYLLISTLTGLDAVRQRANAYGFTVEIIAEESYPFEKLLVLELVSE